MFPVALVYASVNRTAPKNQNYHSKHATKLCNLLKDVENHLF